MDFSKIKLLLTDNDGVLTDGGFYYSNSGDVSVKYNSLDGMGIVLLQEKFDVEVVIISGSGADYISNRAKKLGIKIVHLNCYDKVEIVKQILLDKNLQKEEVVFIGDDVNDIDAMNLCGIRVAVANAHSSLLPIVDYVCVKNGGDGAIRELADIIINAKSNKTNWKI